MPVIQDGPPERAPGFVFGFDYAANIKVMQKRSKSEPRGQRWRLPEVAPHVARRRAIFLAVASALVIAVVAWPLVLGTFTGTGAATVETEKSQTSALPEGCSLAAGTDVIRLSLNLAMTALRFST